MSPVNLDGSVPPKESTPSGSSDEMGLKDTPRTDASIFPWVRKLSTTVGTAVERSGVRVPMVRSVGPTLLSTKSCLICCQEKTGNEPEDAVIALETHGS